MGLAEGDGNLAEVHDLGVGDEGSLDCGCAGLQVENLGVTTAINILEVNRDEPLIVLGALGQIFTVEVVHATTHMLELAISIEALLELLSPFFFFLGFSLLFLELFSFFFLKLLGSFLYFLSFGRFGLFLLAWWGCFSALGLRIGRGFGRLLLLFFFKFDSRFQLLIPHCDSLRRRLFLLRLEQILTSPVGIVSERTLVFDRYEGGFSSRERLHSRVDNQAGDFGVRGNDLELVVLV